MNLKAFEDYLLKNNFKKGLRWFVLFKKNKTPFKNWRGVDRSI